jgi:hypothetical protein
LTKYEIEDIRSTLLARLPEGEFLRELTIDASTVSDGSKKLYKHIEDIVRSGDKERRKEIAMMAGLFQLSMQMYVHPPP